MDIKCESQSIFRLEKSSSACEYDTTPCEYDYINCFEKEKAHKIVSKMSRIRNIISDHLVNVIQQKYRNWFEKGKFTVHIFLESSYTDTTCTYKYNKV
jgi:hypothetical protein